MTCPPVWYHILAQNARRLRRSERSSCPHALTHGLTLYERHREEHDVIDLIHSVDGNDVGMRELLRSSGFLKEPTPQDGLSREVRR